jgi:ribonuclease BN (tRNA processing enzyme)
MSEPTAPLPQKTSPDAPGAERGLRFTPLGVGDAFSTRHYSSALAVEAEGSCLLVDCPHPIRKMLREAAHTSGLLLDAAQVCGIALTHLHGDHASGVECFGFFLRFVLGRRIPLVTRPDVAARLWDSFLAGSMEWVTLEAGTAPLRRELDDFYQVIRVHGSESARVGPFAIECRPTIHSIPATAFRIRAAGRCLGYSGDAAFEPALVDWLAEADLVVHETNPGLLHTPYEKLAALPPVVRDKMRLIHYPDDFDVTSSVVEPLRQGRSYSV